MDIIKGTHKEYKTELFMPIMKQAEGKYIAVLSDDSVDRDEEKLSKGCVEKIGADDNYLAALLNHDNDILNLVAEWVNKRVVEIDGHTVFVAEPKFYKSNPRAQIIKGMLDEGAKPGISIGAMVKNYDEVNDMRVFTELELVEASFVAIPSNRHGRAMAVAKSFKGKEESKVEKEYTQKDIDSAVEKKVAEALTKQLETKDAEIAKMTEDFKKSAEEAETKVAEAETKVAEAETKVEDANKALDAVKQEALEKVKHTQDKAEISPEDMDKALSEGMLPIMRG